MKRPNRVDFDRNSDDMRVLVLGSMGFSVDYISGQTGLSRGQVAYRLLKRGVRLTDFRNGRTLFAQLIIKSVDRDVETRIRRTLAPIRDQKRTA